MRFYQETAKTPSKDYSGAGILLSNVLAIVYALIAGWSLGAMMGIYWVQSVIIGFFHFFRILLLRSFSTEGFTSNGQRVPETAKGKRSTAFFFAVHYGVFHFVYAIFLVIFAARGTGEDTASETAGNGGWDRALLLLSVLGFLLGHGYSFYRNVKADLAGCPNLGTMMFLPYARVVPMHLMILLGSQVGSGTASLLLFSGLKTGADYLMHIVEHRFLQKKVDTG